MKEFPCSVALAILTAGIAFAQPAPKFEVASVKPSAPGAQFGLMNGGPIGPGPFNMTDHDPLRITWTNTRLIRILMLAYDLPGDHISGPPWLGTEMYDIAAPVPSGTTVADFKLMVQNLLAERFHLTLHREMKEVSGYALEVAKTGSKLKASELKAAELKASNSDPQPDTAATKGTDKLMIVDATGFPAPRPGSTAFLPGAGFSATIKVNDLYRATVLNQSLPTIAKFLGTAAGAPVEDHTGLTGVYDFHLEYKPNLPDTPDISAPAPDLFDAIQTQLGLRLIRKKVPQETLVIDHAERIPTPN